ncbi:hypothetical protein [Brevibacillus laterosporus]|uniref:hypothetical protein n=1 Tax=Brevibacillus laterosporus TaxID=1465 RepID=UPI003D25149D
MAKKLTKETQETVLDAFNLVIQEARQAYEAEKSEQAATWKKELARLKEEDLYQFNKDKRDREDELAEELQNRVSAVAEREAIVTSREKAIENIETTLSELQAKVDSIPDLVAKAEATGYAKGKSDAKKDFDNEVRMIKAEDAAEKRILEHALKAVQATAQTQEETIIGLREDLKSANNRVETIATNAVTAAGQSKVTVQTATSSK